MTVISRRDCFACERERSDCSAVINLAVDVKGLHRCVRLVLGHICHVFVWMCLSSSALNPSSIYPSVPSAPSFPLPGYSSFCLGLENDPCSYS